MKSNVETIPSGWKYKRLDDVFILARGGSPRPINDFLTEDVDGYNWIKIGDTKNIDKYIYSTKQKIKKEGLSKTQLVKEDDFILSNSMSFGRPYIMKTEGCIHDGWLLLRKKDKDLSIDFMYYLLSSEIIRSQFKNKAAGSTVLNLNIKLVASVKALIPTYTEQQKIAEILSTVDEKIDAIDQRIAETQVLKKGLMQQLLTKGIGHTKFKDSPLGEIPESWEVVKQGEVATFYNGRAYKLKEWEKEGTPVIRLQNLTGSGKEYYYSNLSLPEHQYCHNGDLLYMWSATFGPVFWKGDKAIFHYHIWKVEHSNHLDKHFHYYLLDNVTMRMKNESHGSTMLHVTKGGMEKLNIQLPPIKEQRKIAEILSSVDEKLQIQQDKKTEYQALKKGLMQQLLTGKMRVSLPKT